MASQYVFMLVEKAIKDKIYLGFTPMDSDELVRRVFKTHYGYEPEKIMRLAGVVLAGPVEVDDDSI